MDNLKEAKMAHNNKIVQTILSKITYKNHIDKEGILNGEYRNDDTGEVTPRTYYTGFFMVKEMIEAHRKMVRTASKRLASLSKDFEAKSAPYRKGGKLEVGTLLPKAVERVKGDLITESNKLKYLSDLQKELDEAIEFFGGLREDAHYDVIASDLDERLTGKKKVKVITSQVPTEKFSKSDAKELDEALDLAKEFYAEEVNVNPINNDQTEVSTEANQEEVY